VAAIGLKEILVIGVVVLLLFGTSILPRIARNGGKRLRETKSVLEIRHDNELERSQVNARLHPDAGGVHRTFAVIAALSRVCTHHTIRNAGARTSAR
jgi:TatA/E family protein of Tat protein translocase